jgi:chemotaxis protein CheC
MNKIEKTMSPEQTDFLTEMMNIGAGHATTALTQMLKRRVDTIVPRVLALPAPELTTILSNPSLPATAIKVNLVGDITGCVFFIVPQQYMRTLTDMVRQANAEWLVLSAEIPHPAIKSATHIQPSDDPDTSIVAEIGNILVGVYMRAINEFCKLNICHTVPATASDMIQSLLDEVMAQVSSKMYAIILIENQFTMEEQQLMTYLLIIPSTESIKTLTDSIEQAREVCYGR